MNNKLNRMLGYFLSKTNRPNEAVDSFRFALSIDPDDQLAADSLDGIGTDLMNETLLTPENLPATMGFGFGALANAPRRDRDAHRSRFPTEPLLGYEPQSSTVGLNDETF